MHDYLEIKLYSQLNYDNNNFHLLDVTVPTPLTTELPPRKTGQHLKQMDLPEEIMLIIIINLFFAAFRDQSLDCWFNVIDFLTFSVLLEKMSSCLLNILQIQSEIKEKQPQNDSHLLAFTDKGSAWKVVQHKRKLKSSSKERIDLHLMTTVLFFIQ